MQETSFDPAGDVILVDAMIQGPRRRIPARLLVDTGATTTLIVPDVLDQLGYSPRDGQVMTTVSSAIGKEHGYTLLVSQLSALGFTFSNFPINVFDLADPRGIDGLLGLNFLRQFNYEIRSGPLDELVRGLPSISGSGTRPGCSERSDWKRMPRCARPCEPPGACV